MSEFESPKRWEITVCEQGRVHIHLDRDLARDLATIRVEYPNMPMFDLLFTLQHHVLGISEEES